MNTLNQVKEAIAETLNVPSSSITSESSADSIDAWDSLAQVNLMITIEQTFDIMLDVEDFMNLNSVASITEFIDKNADI